MTLLPLIYTDSTATILFLAACLIWLVPETIAMPRQMASAARKTAALQDRNSLIVLLGLQWIGITLDFLLSWFLTSATIHWHRTAVFVLGLVCVLLGVGLRWYAIRTLGNYFTRDVAVSADQQTVRGGPYRLIRHPAYSGTFLTMLGLGLAIGNWAGLLFLLACVALGHLYRVKIEERALVRTLGQPYLEYMRATRRFIPWVY